MPSGVIMIRNFGGGLNLGSPEEIASNQASELEGFLTVEGKLQTMNGRTAVAETDGFRDYFKATLGGTEYVFGWYGGTIDYSFLMLNTGETTLPWRPVVDLGYPVTYGTDYSKVVYGNYLYVLGAKITVPQRIEPFSICAGTYTVNGGALTSVVISGTHDLSGVRQGDTIWLHPDAATPSDTRRWYPYYIRAINTSTRTITIDSNATAASAKWYHITRVHQMGIAPINAFDAYGATTGITATAVGGGSGTLAAGTYQFAVTLYNSMTGFESKPVYIANVVCAANDSVLVSNYDLNPVLHGGIQADKMRIYRTAVGGTTEYYKVKECKRSSASWNFVGNPTWYTVHGSEALGDTLIDNQQLPPIGGYLSLWNGRLMIYAPTAIHGYGSPTACLFEDTGDLVRNEAHGLSDGTEIFFRSIVTTTGITANQLYYVISATADTFQVSATAGGAALTLTTDGSGTYEASEVALATQNYLWMANLDAQEYWPAYQFSVTDPTGVDLPEITGGFIMIGGDGSAIMDAIPESGSLSGTREGSSLLVLKRSGPAYRVWGRDWNTWIAESVFSTSAIRPRTAVERNGVVFWCSNEGPIMRQSGSSTPLPIYMWIYPDVTRPFVAYESGVPNAVTTGFWRDYFLFGSQAGSSYRMFLYHISSGTWMEMPADAGASYRYICRGIPGGTGNQTLYMIGTGGVYQYMTNTGSYSYWTGTTGIATTYTSPEFWGERGHETKLKRITSIEVLNSSAGSITMTVLPDGATSGTSVTRTSAVSQQAYRWRKFVPRSSDCEGCAFAFKLNMTNTTNATIRAIIARYEVIGDAPI